MQARQLDKNFHKLRLGNVLHGMLPPRPHVDEMTYGLVAHIVRPKSEKSERPYGQSGTEDVVVAVEIANGMTARRTTMGTTKKRITSK